VCSGAGSGGYTYSSAAYNPFASTGSGGSRPLADNVKWEPNMTSHGAYALDARGGRNDWSMDVDDDDFLFAGADGLGTSSRPCPGSSGQAFMEGCNTGAAGGSSNQEVGLQHCWVAPVYCGMTLFMACSASLAHDVPQGLQPPRSQAAAPLAGVCHAVLT